jgi:predicted nucleotidyltransferase component of viral defense system
MAAVDFQAVYALQDRVLESLSTTDTKFYLTGGTCINRFFLEKRYSDDLDLFTNDNALYREDGRRLMRSLSAAGLPADIRVDTRDFMRLTIDSKLQVDLVNDRVFHFGSITITDKGYPLDNPRNVCANKLTALVGRDEPKDVFDLYVLSCYAGFDWKEILEIASIKAAIDREILEYRLKSFPLALLDHLVVSDEGFLRSLHKDYPALVDDITNEKANRFHE